MSYTAVRSGIGALARVFPPIRWLAKAAGVGAQAIACVHVAMFIIYAGLRTLSTVCIVVCIWDDFVRSKEGANSVEVRLLHSAYDLLRCYCVAVLLCCCAAVLRRA